MTTKRLPRRFVEDHIDRSCAPRSIVQRWTKRHVYVQLSAEQEAELRSDADYYASEARHMGSGYLGLGASARATLAALNSD
jgi:hypothetical protein